MRSTSAKKAANRNIRSIEKDELREDDVIAETIVEDEKTEEKENENGEKETVVVSPRTERYKINKRPSLMNDIHPLWTKHPNDCTDEEIQGILQKCFP